MALGGSSRLHTTSLLEQLLEEINFQRTKEMRQLLKDDSGFVVLQGTTYWTDLFVRHFLFQEERSIDCDDLLFFVRKRHVKGSSRYLPKYETDVEVFRKDSKKLPIGDPEIDWEETVYLNLIVHQFDYTLTLAICTRTSPKELQVLKRHSQKVYASPSRRKMDTKGEGEEMTYPHICFMVDNFDEVFCDIVVRDGEMVCVELVARGRGAGTQAVIFLGSIRYDALTRVYDSRQSSLSTKVAARMSFGLLGSSAAARCEFVRMKGPCGKGHAEMAVSKPRGSGIETPSSEPGMCNTDMWDSDWEEDPEELFVYRHQRRLSDPSANINNFVRGGWRTRDKSDKSRSENEGLDSLVSGIAEVEAGDLRDAGAASSAAMRGLCAPRPAPRSPACLARRAARAPPPSPARRQPPPLAPLPPLVPIKPPKLTSNRKNLKTNENTTKNNQNDLKNNHKDTKNNQKITKNTQKDIKINQKDTKNNQRDLKNNKKDTKSYRKDPKDNQVDECEIADDAASLDESDIVNASPIRVIRSVESRETVRGIEELASENDWDPKTLNYFNEYDTKDSSDARKDSNGNEDCKKSEDGEAGRWAGARAYVTLPRRLSAAAAVFRRAPVPPLRTTPDGTNIYYWCDLPKKHELDDGAYNPLWAMRGFTQTFHLWKEGRRAQCTPLNAYLTYVTLPWWSIAKDILDHREEPILTF